MTDLTDEIAAVPGKHPSDVVLDVIMALPSHERARLLAVLRT